MVNIRGVIPFMALYFILFRIVKSSNLPRWGIWEMVKNHHWTGHRSFLAVESRQALGKALDGGVELQSFGRCQKDGAAGGSHGDEFPCFFRDSIGPETAKICYIQICFFDLFEVSARDCIPELAVFLMKQSNVRSICFWCLCHADFGLRLGVQQIAWCEEPNS